MKMNINKRIPLFLAIIVLYIIQVSQINIKYPNRVQDTLSLGDTFDYQNCQITVLDWSLLNKNDFIQLLGPSIDDEEEGEWDEILITVAIKNSSSEEVLFDLTRFLLESDGWWNGMDIKSLSMLNDFLTSSLFKIRPNNKLIVKLPYRLRPIQFTKIDWENIMQRDFDLIASVYPITQTVILKAKS